MSSFESWMRQHGLSESSVKKYGSAVSGPLTSWANANAVFIGSLADIEDLSAFESISSSLRKLPIFIERNGTGHGMYNAALVKFAEFLKRDGLSRMPGAGIEVTSSPSLDSNHAWSQTAMRMVKTAQQTANASNGQEVLQVIKNKNNSFASLDVFSQYVSDLIERQNFRCAITGLLLQQDDLANSDDELKASLDRIDSDGHYEPGNLQVVCRFINRWKGAGQNSQFLSLMEILRQHWQCNSTHRII